MNTILTILFLTEMGTGEANLSDWISLALENSPEIVDDQAAVMQSEASWITTRSSLLPALSAQGSASRSWMEDVQGDMVSGDLNVSGGLSLSVPLLSSGGSDWLRLESASLETDIAELNLRSANLSLQQSVAQAYYRTVGSLQRLESARVALTRDSILLERTEVLGEMGALTSSDVLAARLQETSSRISVLEIQGECSSNLEELRRAAGVLDDQGWTVSSSLLPSPLSATDLAALSFVPDANPSYQTALLRAEVARIDHSSSQRERYPSLSANGSWNWNAAGDDPGSLDGSTSFTTGLSLTVPIFDGGRISAGVNAARASVLSAEATVEVQRQSLQASLNSLFREMETSLQSLELAELSVEYAADRLDLTEARYDLGAISLDELIDARNELTQSEYQLVESRIQCLEQEVSYRVLCGMDVRSGDRNEEI